MKRPETLKYKPKPYAQIRIDGSFHINRPFLNELGLPKQFMFSLQFSDDGLTVTINTTGGKRSSNNGSTRIGAGRAHTVISAIERNKPADYPYKYKGVYHLTDVKDGVITGTLTDHVVQGISVSN